MVKRGVASLDADGYVLPSQIADGVNADIKVGLKFNVFRGVHVPHKVPIDTQKNDVGVWVQDARVIPSRPNRKVYSLALGGFSGVRASPS